MLLQEEDAGGGDSGGLAGAGAAMLERVENAQAEAGPETPEERPETEGEPAPDGDETPVAPGPEQPAATDEFVEFDYNGARQKLTRSEAENLMRYAIRLHEDAYRASQRGAGPQPEAPKPLEAKLPEGLPSDTAKAIEQYIESRLGPLSQRVEDHAGRFSSYEQQVAQQEMLNSSAMAMGKHKAFSDMAQEDRRFFQGVVLYAKASNPDMSWESAAKRAADFLDKRDRNQRGQYVKAKIEQAARRTDGPGGGSPAPDVEKPDRKDLFNGKAMKSALRRVTEHLRVARG
jgi:hypothetical protein